MGVEKHCWGRAKILTFPCPFKWGQAHHLCNVVWLNNLNEIKEGWTKGSVEPTNLAVWGLETVSQWFNGDIFICFEYCDSWLIAQRHMWASGFGQDSLLDRTFQSNCEHAYLSVSGSTDHGLLQHAWLQGARWHGPIWGSTARFVNSGCSRWDLALEMLSKHILITFELYWSEKENLTFPLN